jgi:hypothetical protein
LVDLEAEEEPGIGSMYYYDNDGALQPHAEELRADQQQQAMHEGVDAYDFNDGWMVPDDAPIEYVNDHSTPPGEKQANVKEADVQETSTKGADSSPLSQGQPDIRYAYHRDMSVDFFNDNT